MRRSPVDAGEQLIQAAVDRTMHEAKCSGKNRCVRAGGQSVAR
jgi:PleD family two-component response regulator